jgi:ribulose-5-phosphate 4-epimerase/fuculose-1-phosphate aldolase
MLTQTITQPTLTLRPTVDSQADEPIAKFDYGPGAPVFTDKHAERQYLKERLALAYRVLARECAPEGSAGHLSVRDPVDPSCFWVNPFGLHFSRMTASDLLLVDHAGRVVGGGREGKRTYNAAAFVIHSAIHEARPDVAAVVHAHTPHGKAFSTLGRPLPYYTQDSAVFWDDCALYAAHGGVVLSARESGEIVAALGAKKSAILQNHGLLAAGGCIESAVAWFML